MTNRETFLAGTAGFAQAQTQLRFAIGLSTPPVGTVLNVVAGVARVDPGRVARGVLPFLAA